MLVVSSVYTSTRDPPATSGPQSRTVAAMRRFRDTIERANDSMSYASSRVFGQGCSFLPLRAEQTGRHPGRDRYLLVFIMPKGKNGFYLPSDIVNDGVTSPRTRGTDG